MRAFLADLGYTTAVTAADTTLFTNTWNEIYAPPGPSANTGGIIGNYDVDGYVTWLYPVQAFGPAPTINLSEFSKLVVARIELSLAHRTLNVIDNPVLRTLYLVDTSYEDLSDLIIKDCPSLTALGLDFPGYGTASYWDLSQITARYPDIYKYWPINDSNIVAQPFEVSLPTVTAPTTVYSMEQNSTDTITITATPATSSGTLEYQWYETDSSGTTSSIITGATSETYSPDTSTIGGPYYYYCVVTSIDEYDNGNSEQLKIKTGTPDRPIIEVNVVAAPPVTYTLTVTNGTDTSAAGPYTAGTVVNITADSPASGMVFDQWTGDVANVADVFAASTTITMPSSNATVIATYKSADFATGVPPQYTLSVVNGSGDGNYAAGDVISIKADDPPAGKVFDKWVSENGGAFADVTKAETTYTMGAFDDEITATYKDAPVAGDKGKTITGDSANIILWIVTLLLSGAVLMRQGLMAKRRSIKISKFNLK